MKFRKNTRILLLISLIIFNLILRYPIIFHEIGVDSFGIHIMANSISNSGYAEWILNPESFFGLYPLSYPSGTTFILSGISQAVGIDMESSIFIFSSLILTIFGIFSIYLLTKELFKDDLFIFLSIFVFSIAPLYVSYTNFNVTTRGTFLTFLPFFMWILMKFVNSLKIKYLLISFFIFILMASFHRMIVFIIMILILFAFGIFDVKFKIQGTNLSTPYIIRLLMLLFLFFSLLFLQFAGKGFQTSADDYSEGSFFKGSSPIIIILNMGLNYATGISPLIIFIPIGLLTLFPKAAEKAGNERFMIYSLFVVILIMTNKQYGRSFSLVFISILVAYSISLFAKKINNKKLCYSLIIIILLMSASFSALIPLYREKASSRVGLNVVSPRIEKHTLNLGIYMLEYTKNTTTMSNNEIIGERVAAISKNACDFPSGSAILICNIVSKENLTIVSGTMGEFIARPDEFWKLKDWSEPGMYYDSRHRTGLEKYPGTDYEKHIFSIYSFNYSIKTREGTLIYSSLFNRISGRAHSIYDNGMEELWYFGDISYRDLLNIM